MRKRSILLAGLLLLGMTMSVTVWAEETAGQAQEALSETQEALPETATEALTEAPAQALTEAVTE